MTALPVRCRKTKDALRKPLSVAAWRTRRAFAERSWVGCALRPFGFPEPRPRLSKRLMRARREAARLRPGPPRAAMPAPRQAAQARRPDLARSAARWRRVEPRPPAARPAARHP